MPLPSFTITGTLFDLLGNVAAGEIVGNGLGGATPATVTFTSNVPQGYFVTFGGVAYRVDEVTAIVNSDGTITRNGDPVQLLANDAGLSIDGLQWQCHVNGMNRFWFNAPVDGGTVNLGTVAPVPGIGVGGVTFSEGELITLLADGASPLRVALDALYVGIGTGAMRYKGVWNATTNSPTLADGTGHTGDFYHVSPGGTQNLGSGAITFTAGDYALYNGTTWEKADTTDAVASVFGRTGAITGTPSDVAPSSSAAIAANTAPTRDQITIYDATSGALAVALPALSGLTSGWVYPVQRYQLDVSTNAITFTPNGADTFDSGSTTFSLPLSGELRFLQVVTVAASKKWKVVGGNTPVGSNDKRYFSLNDGPFSGIATMLRDGRSAIMQGFGDSTMSGPGRAFDMMATDLGGYAAFDANVWYMPFDDTNKTYFNPTVLRASSRGVRGVGGTGGKVAGTYQGTIPVGNIDIQMMVTAPSWTPAGGGELLTKWDEAVAGAGHSDQKGIHFGLGATGQLYFGWTTDGATNPGAKVSTVSVPFAAGATGWVRAVFVANDGSGNNTVTFYTSTSGFNWVQLGSVVTTAGVVTAVFQSTEPYQLLSRNREFATQHMPVNTFVHFVRVRDAAGNDYVPLLPDKWDPNTTSTLEPVYNSGAPILLAASGAISGWNLNNLTDPARYTQLMSLRGADMIIVDDGHNENSFTQRQFINQYVSFIRRLKRSKPLVPIVCVTQNPYDKAGTAWTSEPGIADLNPTKMAWMARAMAGESGVWVADTFQAFTNPTIGNDLSADGRHPSAVGYQKKADFTRRFLLPKAF